MSECPTWQGTIRKLWATDLDRIRDHLHRLDVTARRMRFAHAVSDQFIDQYVEGTTTSGNLAFGYFNGGHLRAIAELRKLSVNWGCDAEAAFTVEAEYQNRGIGTELMGHVIRAARNRRIRHLYMSCLPDNRRMQAIARRYDGDLKFEYGEVVGEISPSDATYFSMLNEMFDDRVGFVLAVLDLGIGHDKAA